MDGIINYLAFIVVVVIVVVVVVFSILLFELPGGNRFEVEKSGQTHIPLVEPGQGYWDYALVAGMGIVLLLEIFLINI